MQHPFLKNYKAIAIYFLVWTLLIVGGVFFNNEPYPLNITILCSVVDIYLFSLLIIPVWYVARYTGFSQTPVRNLLFNHISTLVVFILIWVFIGYEIKINITKNEELVVEYFWRFISDRILACVIFYLVIMLLYYLAIYNNDLKEKLKTESELKNKVQEAQLSMLKSQINPHFLFNSLNSISSLTISNPKKAQQMIIKLSDFLRYSISKDTHQKSTLRLEIENITRYLEIEKTRFGDRFVFEPEIDEACYDCIVPVMILQPLFENAIKHGVYESIGQIKIGIQCTCNSNSLIVKVSNNYDPDAIIKKGAGIGLRNIRERLLLTYQVDGLLSTTNQNNVFEVKLIIPQR